MPELSPSWQFPRACVDARGDSNGTRSPRPSGVPPLIHRSSALGGRDLNADRHVLEPDRGTVGPRRRVHSQTGQSGEGRIGGISARGLGPRKNTALGADRPILIGG